MSNPEVMWPANWAERRAVVKDAVDRLEQLEAIATPVVVHSFAEPTQDQWEAAFVKATGLLPPIPPGTKMMWYDLRAKEMRAYTTAYDLQLGAETSGTVVPWVKPANTQSAFRFLGYLNPVSGYLMSAWSDTGNGFNTLLVNPALWQSRGLIALEIYYEINGDTTDALTLGFDSQVYDFGFEAEDAGYDTITLVIAPNRATNPAVSTVTNYELGSRSQSWLPITAQFWNTTASDQRAIGKIHISTPIGINVPGSDQELMKTHAPNVAVRGVEFGPTLTSASLDQYWCFAEMAERRDLSRPRLMVKEMTTYPTAGTDIVDVDNRAWVYGYFNQQTPANLEEYV
jgi:hypothetical protein